MRLGGILGKIKVLGIILVIILIVSPIAFHTGVDAVIKDFDKAFGWNIPQLP